MHPVEFSAGLLLVLGVFVDVFSTVLVPRPSRRGARMGPILAALLAHPWRKVVDLFGSARLRQDVRGALAPLILVLSLAGWVAGLAFGFALMLQALPGDMKLADHSFGEALFETTLALSTLGIMHAQIDGGARAIVAIAGVTGFATVSLVVAFLLQIQNGLHAREEKVLTLAARAGRPPSACAILTAFHDAQEEELADLFNGWESWVGEIVQSHLSYPVLLRFRSLDEDFEWLTCLAALLDAAALTSAADRDRPRAVRAASFLLATGRRAAHEIGRLLKVRPIALDDAGSIARALDRLGLPADAAGEVARLRESYAPRLAAVAARLDIAMPDTMAGDPG